MRLIPKALFSWVIVVLVFFALAHSVFAETTPYRSATTITTDGATPFTNLSNCSATDGATCDHASATNFANLYFSDFGDFGIPEGSTIASVKIRVTGKADVGLYVGVSKIGSPIVYASNCQTPSDRWRATALVGSNISTYNVTTPLTIGALASCLSYANIKSNNFIFRINYSASQSWSANIDNFEIAFDYTPAATPTPTPTPTGPEPFLDLPWDYEGQGQAFSDAALAVNSYFDHEYPLLSGGLDEGSGFRNSVVSYKGGIRNPDLDYSSHDGYDWAKLAKVNIGDPVLAAAAGTAIYINSCAPCGNMILIDHGNGYQTRYLHLQKDGLITNIPNNPILVNTRQQIGKVGATGNVQPAGDAGAHIHFGIFQDKNNDGNFDDNIPDGVTDPFGWQSDDPDPWENYSFFYGGIQRSGNKSYYLWKKSLGGISSNLTPAGGSFSAGRYSVDFPSDAVSQNTTIELTPQPIVSPTEFLSSVGTTLLATAKDSLGNIITDFLEPFTLTSDFSNIDLTRYDLSTLSIYSSQDGEVWNQELTDIDFINNKATTTISHFTNFALMAERIDTIAPTTVAFLSGKQNQTNWFRSDVETSLFAQDNAGGLGVDYTMFRLNDEDWEQYLAPLSFQDEGHYKIEFYSSDNDENMEDVKSVEFDIDKTPPEVEIKFNVDTLDADIIGHDSSGSAIVNVFELPKKKNSIKITDQAGNVLELIGKDKEKGNNAKITIESLQYNEGALINVDPTKLLVSYNLDSDSLELQKLTQTFEIKGELKIKLVYWAKTDKTQVITKVKGQEKVKEELTGVKILKLTTENGTLNYSY